MPIHFTTSCCVQRQFPKRTDSLCSESSPCWHQLYSVSFCSTIVLWYLLTNWTLTNDLAISCGCFFSNTASKNGAHIWCTHFFQHILSKSKTFQDHSLHTLVVSAIILINFRGSGPALSPRERRPAAPHPRPSAKSSSTWSGPPLSKHIQTIFIDTYQRCFGAGTTEFYQQNKSGHPIFAGKKSLPIPTQLFDAHGQPDIHHLKWIFHKSTYIKCSTAYRCKIVATRPIESAKMVTRKRTPWDPIEDPVGSRVAWRGAIRMHCRKYTMTLFPGPGQQLDIQCVSDKVTSACKR